jgi:hypothetical protein
MPLTIASRDRSEYDKWAHLALSRKSPIIATIEDRHEEHGVPTADRPGRPVGMTPQRSAERRARVLEILATETLTRDQLWFQMRSDFSLPSHVGRLLSQLKAEGLVDLLKGTCHHRGNYWRKSCP